MNFDIDNTPPSLELLEQERQELVEEIKRLSFFDTMITFVFIIFSSALLGLIIFWYTNNIRYAGISVAVFPIIGTVLSLLGITKSTGFRSAANRISELHNELIGLNFVSNENMKDINMLSSRHMLVSEYQKKLELQGRAPVNGELALYWEFDTSTMAKTARGRDFLAKAKDSVTN